MSSIAGRLLKSKMHDTPPAMAYDLMMFIANFQILDNTLVVGLKKHSLGSEVLY